MKTEEVQFLKNPDEIIQRMHQTAVQLTNLKEFEGIRENVKKLVGSILQTSKIEVHFFGSRVIGIGTCDSDLDIFVEIDGSFVMGVSKNAADNFNKVVQQFKNSADWKVNTVVVKTPVPVINATPTFKKIDCKYLDKTSLKTSDITSLNCSQATSRRRTAWESQTPNCWRICSKSNRKP